MKIAALGYTVTFVAGFAVCALVLRLTQGGPGGSLMPTGREAVAAALARTPVAGRLGASLPSVSDAVARVAPAVVNLDITGERPSAPPLSLPVAEPRPTGSGSGILLSPDGYILTNNHVIAPAVERNGDIWATLADGRRFHVILVGRDAPSDLAVVKIPGGKGFPAAELGDSEQVRVGDWAIAVGNPLGFNSTVTLGIVSALNRDYLRRDNVALDKVIQTDAPINLGNSGGALADAAGRVVGVNTAIATSGGATVGIGFAIPINTARRVAAELIAHGQVERPYLGVAYTPRDLLEPEMIPPGLQLPDTVGAVILPRRDGGIINGSPADRAGIQEWDVVTAIDGRWLRSADDVRTAVMAHKVGDTLKFTIWRNGTTLDVSVTLERMPDGFGK